MTTILAHASNYTKGRTKTIDRIVVHYTAGDGDTAENNGTYFSGANRSASAHYFVDEDSVVQSVADGDTAWHAGNWDMNCRSIGVEMCSRKNSAGKYYIPEKTMENAKTLIRELMRTYGIGVSGVIRHYDVTGKSCPKPMVEDAALWQAFRQGLVPEEPKTEPTDSRPSAWAEADCAWAVALALFEGDETGNFRWQEPVTREQLAAVLHRMAE